MRKPFLLAVMALLSMWAGAQTVVQVGNGTTASPITNFAPVFRMSAGSSSVFARSNMVFRSEQLQNAGLTAGHYITQLSFFKTNSHYLLQPGRVRILMANSSRSQLATTDTWTSILQTHTQVALDSTVTLAPTAGWQAFPVTPFLYTGGNLEIAFECSSVPGATGASGAIAWQFTFPADATAMVGIQGTAFQDVMSSVSTGYRTLLNTRFTIVPATTLSLQFTHFSAQTQGSSLALRYELNVRQAIPQLSVEASQNGRDFQVLITLQQTNPEGVVSVNPDHGFYRLVATDALGQKVYSTVLRTTAVEPQGAFRLLENPVQRSLRFWLAPQRAGQAHFAVADAQGRILRVASFRLLPGGQQHAIALPRLAPGIYFLKWIGHAESLSFQIQ